MNTLPRTRTFQRRRPWTAWWVAVGIAVITNIIVVIILSQISNMQHSVSEPPLTTLTFRHIAPPPPPPPPPPPIVQETPAVAAAKPTAIPLPALELPSNQPMASLAIPTLPTIDSLIDLPVSVPAFDAITADIPEQKATLWPGTGAPDEPAQLESTFDLERFYPRIAKLRGIGGQSFVRITIDHLGQVLSAHVYKSTPQGVFEIATQDLARSLSFRPARLQGKPVASTKDLVIDWTLK